MASVAAAIANVAVNVDSSLYWSSHAELFEFIEKYGQEQREEDVSDDGADGSGEREHRQDLREQQFARKLEAHHPWLLNTLGFFKGPSDSSKSALDNPSIKLGQQTLTIKDEIKGITLQVSSHLELDQIQACILLTRFIGMDKGGVAPETADRAFLEKISLFYYVERQCLLKCLRSLLTFQQARDVDRSRYHVAMRTEVRSLVAEKLEEKIVQVMKKHLASTRPKHVTAEFADMWAEETGREQALLLDILFLLYYDPNLVRCSPTRFKELLTVFKAHLFVDNGESMSRLAVTAEAEKIVLHVRHLAVLVLIDAMDLDSVLMAVSEEIPFSGEHLHPFSEKDLVDLNECMDNLDPISSEDHALILMAWAVLLCLFPSLPGVSSSSAPVSENMRYMSQAYAGGAYQYVLQMLQTEAFQEPERHVTGYKSVIKTVMAGFLAAYDIANQTEFEGFDLLVKIFCEIFRGEEELCSALWARDSELDGPIRNLLFSIHKQFPCSNVVPLLHLLRSQCEGAWPAECVYDFLYRMTPVASMYHLPSGSSRIGNGNGNSSNGLDVTTVRTSRDLIVPGAPGLVIPAGTFGHVVRLIDSNSNLALVQWQCEHSSILVLLLRMLEIVKQGSSLATDDVAIQELRAFLLLLDKMLSSSHILAQLLLDLDQSAVVDLTQSSGRVQSRLHGNINVVKIICMVVHELALHFADVEMLATCLRILSCFLPCFPHAVLEELSRTSLLQPAMDVDGLPSSGEWSLADSQIHNLLTSTEKVRGVYPLTLAALQFMHVSLERGLCSDAAAGLVLYMQVEILVHHSSWRYLRRVERWQISAKVLLVLRAVVGTELSAEGVHLKRVVTDALLRDTTVLNALFQVLAVDAHGLEELQYNRTVVRAEIEAVEEAICALLNLLSGLLEKAAASTSTSKKDLPHITPLEHALFNRSVGSAQMVSVIASFLQYSHCVKLQEAAAKLLSHLCFAAWRSRPHPITLASYLSGSSQALHLQRALVGLLSEETAFTVPELFSSVIDLLVAATEWQPTLVEFLLLPVEDPSAMSSKPASDSIATTAGASSTDGSDMDNGLDALWGIVCNSEKLLKSEPQVLSQVLFLFMSLWQSGSVLSRVIDALRTKPSFWKLIGTCLFSKSLKGDVLQLAPAASVRMQNTSSSSTNAPEASAESSMDAEGGTNNCAPVYKRELLALSFRMQCEASVLQLIAFDVFLHQHVVDVGGNGANGSSDKTPIRVAEVTDGSKKEEALKVAQEGLNMVLKWAAQSPHGSPSSTTQRYVSSVYDLSQLQRAQGEARSLVAGLLAQAMAGYERGLHAELSRRIIDISRKMMDLPPMRELVRQYSSRLYSKGGAMAEALVLSDLYHHLRGELEGGRPVPPGPFSELSDLLKDSDTLMKQLSSDGRPSKGSLLSRRHPQYGDCFEYQTAVASSWLGYEWWVESPLQIVSAQVADGALRSMRRSNAVASASYAQMAALNAWGAAIAVAMFDAHGEIRVNLEGVAGSWKLSDVAGCIKEVCKALQNCFEVIGSETGSLSYVHLFTAAQARLLLVLLKWWCALDKRAGGGISQSSALAIVPVKSIGTISNKRKGTQASRQTGELKSAGVDLCTHVVSTVVLCLKVHAGGQGRLRTEGKEKVIPLMTCLLLVLGHLRTSIADSRNGRREEEGEEEDAMECGVDGNDSFSEVVLNGLSVLPLLCTSVLEVEYSSLAIANIDLLCQDYLSPPTWLPIIGRHIFFPGLMKKLQTGSLKEVDESVLGFLLSMTQVTGGALLLQEMEVIKNLSKFVSILERKEGLSPESIEGPLSGIRPEAEREGEWAMTLAIVAMILNALEGREEIDKAVEHALDFVASHSDLMLAAFHVVPTVIGWQAIGASGTAARGTAAASYRGFEPSVCTSIPSLRRTERVVFLLCGLAEHRDRWMRALPGSQPVFKEGCMRVLAYIAREGVGRSGKGIGVGAPGLCCAPKSREELAASKRPALINSKKGWFLICGRGARRGSTSRGGVGGTTKAPISNAMPSLNGGASGENVLAKTGVSATTTTPATKALTIPSSTSPSSTAIVIRNMTRDITIDKMGVKRGELDDSFPSQYSDTVATYVYRLALLMLKFLSMLAQGAFSAMEERGHYDYALLPELPSPEVLHGLQDQCMAILLELGTRSNGCIVDPNLQRVCVMLSSIVERALYLEACLARAYGIVPSPMRAHSFEKDYSQLRPLFQANAFFEDTVKSLRAVLPMLHPSLRS